ncbi:MAG: acyl carrier protein [Pedobacter sp.]|uniref:acyl carrier protein n=1 Tax=Pedobacter agri TaxID=454586 RepID=UPI0012248CD5|nr:acyl carrier protein [Pedobacter agri]RZL69065.1 MAG: acyl carrier protein [Pedobacter sp.]
MENSMILTQVQDIFRDVLDNEEIELTLETTANDVEDWDSLTHIQLIVAIEKTLKVKFTSKEILSWSNVGEMIECIQGKQSV